MTARRKRLLERVASLPEDLLDEVEASLAEIEDIHRGATVRVGAEELAGIDRGLKASIEGRLATAAEVEEVLAGFRKA